MRGSSFRFLLIPATTSLVLFACSEQPPPASPSSGELPLKMSTATPAPLPPPTAESAPSAEPTASASTSAPPPPSGGDGRPPVLKMDPSEITDTFGAGHGAKLELGPEGDKAFLKIPETAFEKGVNVTFKIDPKGKYGGLVLGKIYRLSAMIPPSGTPEKVTSLGPPFELRLPAGNKKDANLAIGEIGARVTWRVIAPIKIDDASGLAYFELTELNDYYLHVTTRPVTTPAK